MWSCYKLAVLLFISLQIIETTGSFLGLGVIIGSWIGGLLSGKNKSSSNPKKRMLTFRRLNEIYSNLLSDVNPQLNDVGESIITSLLNYAQNQTKLQIQLHSLMEYMVQVNVKYDQLEKFINDTEIEMSVLKDFAKNVVSHEIGSIQYILEEIHAFIVPPNSESTSSGILELITESLQETEEDMLCSTNQSAQQILYNLYNSIQLTEMKGYMILQFSYVFNLNLKENCTEEAKLMESRYKEQALQSVEAIKKSMQKTSRDLWKCNPPKHTSGSTYMEVTQLPQSSDKDKDSDCYFNMRPVIADVQGNKVVTGLRFTKHNHIIHLQIQEGKLLPQGEIEKSSVRWVPVEEYKITDGKEGEDFYTLNAEHKSIDLDELIADNGYLLTGVRFKRIGRHLNFQIYTTPFHFGTGQLLYPRFLSVWKENSDTNARTEIKISQPNIPITELIVSKPGNKSNQYIHFTNVAETTAPLLDVQSVASMIPVPLDGAGLYHKGGNIWGGFIAPKIVTFDFSDYLELKFLAHKK